LIQTQPHALVPPRPNLGPEPWSEARDNGYRSVGIGLALAVCLAGALWITWRRRASRRSRPPAQPQSDPQADSPSAQLVYLAAGAREALAARFGPSLRARTTEEIAADLAIREAIGESHVESLIELLSTADRWKFALMHGNGREDALLDNLATGQAWQKTFLAELPAKR
jgi:hypothetical protein